MTKAASKGALVCVSVKHYNMDVLPPYAFHHEQHETHLQLLEALLIASARFSSSTSIKQPIAINKTFIKCFVSQTVDMKYRIETKFSLK